MNRALKGRQFLPRAANHAARLFGRLGGGAESALAAIERAVVLKPGDAQAGKAMAVDEALPGEEFLHRKRITCASFLEAEDAGPDRGNDLGLAANDPALGFVAGEAVEADTRADVEKPVRTLNSRDAVERQYSEVWSLLSA